MSFELTVSKLVAVAEVAVTAAAAAVTLVIDGGGDLA
eukprot:gene1846-2786_t